MDENHTTLKSKSLTDRFFERSGKLADKWEQYLSMYEMELAPYVARGTPISLLEIGVQNGGSLELWSEYLPVGSRIMGIDIDPKVGDLRFDNPNVSVAVLDATDEAALRPLLGNATFDIIIDDGSHVCSDVIRTFDVLFDYLAPGGRFIIEDLHTSYYKSHGGGWRDPASSVEWLKAIIDVLNADHVQPDNAISDRDRALVARLNPLLGRLTFYDSVAVIEKLHREKLRPYRRLSAGVVTDVVPPNWVLNAPRATLDTMLFAHPAARRVDGVLVEELSARQAKIAQLQDSLRQAEQEREAAEVASGAREGALRDEIERLQAALAPPLPPPEPLPEAPDELPDLTARVLAVAYEEGGV